MNGPQHYREAERLIALSAVRAEQSDGLSDYDADVWAVQAQVHATLALAAATAHATITRLLGDTDAVTDWHATAVREPDTSSHISGAGE